MFQLSTLPSKASVPDCPYNLDLLYLLSLTHQLSPLLQHMGTKWPSMGTKRPCLGMKRNEYETKRIRADSKLSPWVFKLCLSIRKYVRRLLSKRWQKCSFTSVKKTRQKPIRWNNFKGTYSIELSIIKTANQKNNVFAYEIFDSRLRAHILR